MTNAASPTFVPERSPKMAGTPSISFLRKMQEKHRSLIAAGESICMEARAAGEDTLSRGASEKLKLITADARALESKIRHYQSELDRVGTVPSFGRQSRAVSSAGRLAPLGFDHEEMRAAHATIGRGGTAQLEARDPGFASADSLLPAQLFPVPTMPRHEDRLLDRLPGFALDAPSLEYIQVTSVSGAATIVGEGQPKPEIDMPATKLIVSALKLACHAGVTWESISDFDAFTAAVQNELLKQLVDLENEQLVYGTGGGTELNGMTTTSGILTLTATGSTATPPNNWDDIAAGIAALRTGPALATPDLLCLHPDSWADIRTQKDTLGRYIGQVLPTEPEPDTAWGVSVLQSTKIHPGDGILLDTQLMGRVAVRESALLRVGYGVVSGVSDFTSNILRWIAEERLNLAVERPAAICYITGLPSAAPTATKSKSSK
jgi:HK97 family phage major capsid protein